MKTICKPDPARSALHQLARFHGVLTSYRDMSQRRQEASPESLLAVLRSLGVPVERMQDVPAALRAGRIARASCVVEPIHVAWQGKRTAIRIRLPDGAAVDTLRCEWQFEDGKMQRVETQVRRLPLGGVARVDNARFVTRLLKLPDRMPVGYHRLVLEVANDRFETLVVCAPERCYLPPRASRVWGAFAPLYALHSKRSWGAGDFGDLAEFITWVGSQGGSFVGTLPLSPAFLDQPCEPSPYSPVSRLCWNEFYLDLTQVIELEKCPPAQRRLQSSAFQARLQKLQSSPLVDYAKQMALKREVLEVLSRTFFARPSARRRTFEQFLKENQHVVDFARFRAVGEQRGQPWQQWPDRLRHGDLRNRDCRQSAMHYYLYTQWLAHEQIAAVSAGARAQGVALYLDLPLGTHGEGYDAWRYRDFFALEASGGAPPDPVFTQGQDWGFAPIHPQRSRERGHAYLRAYLRHHLQQAGMLRIDHVMGLHRLYWVPRGQPASRGAYVTYPAEEVYAILSLESHRHRAVIIGENLGTVPPEVDRSLKRHAIGGMFVGQYEFRLPPKPALRPVPKNVVASLNTHDMPPFEAYWRSLDIEDRRALGLIKRSELAREHQQRRKILRNLIKFLRRRQRLCHNPSIGGAVSRAALTYLAATRARWVLLNLEDLWLENRPQNVPGTSSERVNWRRKTRLTLEQIQVDPAVRDQLRFVNALRR